MNENQNNKQNENSQKEYTNKFRMRINFEGSSLLMETDNFRKKTLLKLSNLRSEFLKDYFLSNNLKFSNKIFGTKLRKINYLLMISLYISEGLCMFYILKSNFNKNLIADQNDKFSELKYQNSIVNVSSLYLLGNYINFIRPKTLFGILFSTFMFKSIGTIQNTYENSSSQEKKKIEDFVERFNFSKVFKKLFMNDLFKIPNLKMIDCNEITIAKQFISFSTVCCLNLFLKSNLKTYNLSNLNIPFFNTKHLKMFLWLFVIGKLSNFFGHLGFYSLDLFTLEGIFLLLSKLLIINPYYVAPMICFFICNPYSLFIFSPTKNNFDDNDTIANEYKKKGYLERFKIRIKFLTLNLFFYTKKIYF